MIKVNVKEHVKKLGWKRDHYVLPADGHSLTQTCLKMREEGRSHKMAEQELKNSQVEFIG